MLSRQTLPVVRHLLQDASVLCLGHPDMDMDVHVYLDSRGCTFKCIDVYQHNGCEEVVNLNDAADLGQWDVVLDHGTIEHCFNVSQALLNAASAVKPGGHIFHSPPLTVINHGYYQISPCLFAEFYKANGWEIQHLAAHYGDKSVPVDGSLACRATVPLGSWLYCIAKRLTDAPLRATFQEKYS